MRGKGKTAIPVRILWRPWLGRSAVAAGAWPECCADGVLGWPLSLPSPPDGGHRSMRAKSFYFGDAGKLKHN